MCEHLKPDRRKHGQMLWCSRCGCAKLVTETEWRTPTILTSGKPIKPRNPKQLTMEQETGFNAFWEIYPLKDGKQTAIASWLKSEKIRPPLEELLKLVKAYAKSKDLKHIAHASTWLNQQRWTDESIKPFIVDPKPNVEQISPLEKKRLELEGRYKAMMEIGTAKALQLADQLKLEMDQLKPCENS